MAATIFAQIPQRFEEAHASGDLLFYPSTIHKHIESDVEFEIRQCPALQKKPTLPTPHFEADVLALETENGKLADPFAPPYVPGLLLGEVRDDEEGDEYVFLLNKYSVVPMHFLMVTKGCLEFKSQASPLSPTDLVHAYTVLLCAKKARRDYFAFYNCGDRSGASQPHKHIQFIPIDDDEGGPPIETLAKAQKLEAENKAFSLTAMPYANHVRRLPRLTLSTSRTALEDTLAQAFMMLLDLVISTVRHDPTHPSGPPSYNVILTLEHMHLIPRQAEHFMLPDTGDRVAVNAMGYAGLMLVKSDVELEAVKKVGVRTILAGVGLPSVNDAQISEPHEAEAPEE